eukprot:5629264-Karenia_brevis.AAC.1
MRGALVKCNAERVRPASDEEWMGREIIRILLAGAKQGFKQGGQHGFVDATSEEGSPMRNSAQNRQGRHRHLLPTSSLDMLWE